MPITETTRHEMLVALETTIGKDATMTLAEHLPPVGWADVVTKTDLSLLSKDMDLLRIEMHRDMATLELRITEKLVTQTRLLYVSTITTVITLVVLGLVR